MPRSTASPRFASSRLTNYDSLALASAAQHSLTSPCFALRMCECPFRLNGDYCACAEHSHHSHSHTHTHTYTHTHTEADDRRIERARTAAIYMHYRIYVGYSIYTVAHISAYVQEIYIYIYLLYVRRVLQPTQPPYIPPSLVAEGKINDMVSIAKNW